MTSTRVVCASWGLGCWQSLKASGWRSDLESSCWPAAPHAPAGYQRLPPGGKTRTLVLRPTFSPAKNGFGFPLTLSIIIWAEGSTLSRASVQLSHGWAKTPSIVSLSSGFTFSSLQGAGGDGKRCGPKKGHSDDERKMLCSATTARWDNQTQRERGTEWLTCVRCPWPSRRSGSTRLQGSQSCPSWSSSACPLGWCGCGAWSRRGGSRTASRRWSRRETTSHSSAERVVEEKHSFKAWRPRQDRAQIPRRMWAKGWKPRVKSLDATWISATCWIWWIYC